MTRWKVHNMSEGGTKQATIAKKCNISIRSVERILTEAAPTWPKSRRTRVQQLRAWAPPEGDAGDHRQDPPALGRSG
jgi:hypothetical protein